ncbi:Os02g0326100, partial [Oryza sativa Japonica Group]
RRTIRCSSTHRHHRPYTRWRRCSSSLRASASPLLLPSARAGPPSLPPRGSSQCHQPSVRGAAHPSLRVATAGAGPTAPPTTTRWSCPSLPPCGNSWRATPPRTGAAAHLRAGAAPSSLRVAAAAAAAPPCAGADRRPSLRSSAPLLARSWSLHAPASQ